MGRKKKDSTQPQEEQLLFTMEEQNPITPEVNESSEDSTGGETINNQTGVENGSSTYVNGNNNKEISTDKTSSNLEDKIRASMDKLRETYLLMGGEEGMKRRKELIFALLKYNGSKDDALSIFREKVSTTGYEDLEENLIPIVAAYGTIKDKVALIVNAHFDMQRDQKTPLLSRKRADEIKAEIRKQGRAAMVEFMNYLSIFDTLRFIYPHFYRAKYTYTSLAFQAIIYFQTYEWLGKAEELFNSFAPLVADGKQEEFRELTKKYNSYLQNYQRFGELDEKSGEGWIDKQREDCLTYADVISTSFCKNRLSQLKGAVEAIKDWIKDNKAEMFLSMELRDQIIWTETECIQELQSKYYHSHLKYMEKRGDVPTEADKKIALFPEYSEVERNENSYKYFYKKLDGYKETYK